MLVKQTVKWYIKLFGLTGFLTVGSYILYYLDKKRTSDPSYKLQVKNEQNRTKQREIDEMKHRLMAFPTSNDKNYIKSFVIQEIEKGEQCMLYQNYNEAVKHFSNGLSLIDYNYKLLNTLRRKVSFQMYRDIKSQMENIQAMLPDIKIV